MEKTDEQSRQNRNSPIKDQAMSAERIQNVDLDYYGQDQQAYKPRSSHYGASSKSKFRKNNIVISEPGQDDNLEPRAHHKTKESSPQMGPD